MRLRKSVEWIKIILVLSIVGIMSCSQNTGITGGTTETTSARLEGVIYNSDGSKAIGATVNLISSNANPFSAKQIDTIIQTTTDQAGAYSIVIDSNGLYNVFAQKMGAYSFTGPVQLSKQKNAEVDDTLKEPGSISGTALLSPRDNNTKIAIVVLGTSTYALTEDTTGNFSIPVLAEGEYVLRFIATNGDYMYIDTTVQVISGKNTSLDHIVELSKYIVPTVGTVSAEFDSTMMTVMVSWPKIDTSKVAGFTLTRICNGTDSQSVILGNVINSYLDDVFLLKGTAVSYAVIAVGIDRSYSAATNSPIVKIEKVNMPDDSILLDPIIASTKSAWIPVKIDKEHNVYLTSLGWLGKFNSSGKLVAEFVIDSMFYQNKGVFNIDSSGNVYVFDAYHSNVYKLSRELKMLKSISVEENTNLILLDNIFIDNNGHVYMFWIIAPEMVVKIFDSELVLKKVQSIPSSYQPPFANNDIVYVLNTKGCYSYTVDGKPVNSWEFGAAFSGNGPKSYFSMSTGEVIVTINDTRSTFKLDKNLKVIGRFRLNGLVFQCDGNDHLCNYDRTNQKVLFYKIP
jgi:hypothetical protein